MTPRFLSFIPFILHWETEYNKDGSVKVERDPDDPGGTTKYGIDAGGHPHVDIPALTKDGAIQIYWEEWIKERIESLRPNFGEVYYNCCINCGQGRGDKIRARTSGEAKAFLAEQEAFYHRLADARPKSKKYLAGWLNRTGALSRFLRL